MAFPYKLYRSLTKLDLVTGMEVEYGKRGVIVYVSHEPTKDDKIVLDLLLKGRTHKFVVADAVGK